MPTVEVKIVYESEFEAEEAAKEYQISLAARRAFADLRDWLRSDTKYGDGKYEEVYEKLFELAKERDFSAWDA
jgi:hypothetical protein